MSNNVRNTKEKKPRARWFGLMKSIMRIFIKKPKYVFLGDVVSEPSLILSNHVGTAAPLALELYFDKPFRFWGAYQMNGNLFKLYGYLSKDFYHNKKHWNLLLSRLFCIIAAPLTWIFYRGLNLISSYPDYRLRNTIKESINTIQKGHSIVIFPEDSTTGYHERLEGVLAGFYLFCKKSYEKGIDLPIYLAYYNKKNKTFTFDQKVYFSSLVNAGLEGADIAKKFCDRLNELGEK